MRHFLFLFIVVIIGGLYGCASTIDSLSNNTSSDAIRGVKLQAGVDASSGNPVPSVTFTMGSLARKGKGDRTVVVIDNNTTDIVSESYEVNIEYDNIRNEDRNKPPRQFIKTEKRTPIKDQFGEGIFVNQTSTFGMGVTAGNLFSTGGGTMISIGKVGDNVPQAILNSKVKPQDVGSVKPDAGNWTKEKGTASAHSTTNPK